MLVKKLVASVVLVSWLTGCASVESENAGTGGRGWLKPAVIDEPVPARLSSRAITKAVPSIKADQAPVIPALSSLYFPFDVYAVQDADAETVLRYAEYLREHPDQNVRVEGNADERGSKDFNLALGQRRADGVKKRLVLSGADDNQIDAVSLGEEQPKLIGHNELAWGQNRRSDIVLLTPETGRRAHPRLIEMFSDCPECPEMVLIPPGSLEMGSVYGETDEAPVHRVTISRPFAMGKTEVTQGQWRAVMGNNPSAFPECGSSCPVEQVSWDDAQEYIRKLSAKTGQQYRLPSEAEWEFACRAEEMDEYCGGDNPEIVAWYGAHAYPNGNSGNKTNPVAGKQANAFGLFDMSGNVWEWVEDGYHASYTNAPADSRAWAGADTRHVLRGGSWDYFPQYVRATVRGWDESISRANIYGFRVVRALP